jgi:hypothetical protein
MQIDESEGHFSNRDSLDPVSKVTVVRLRQPEKQYWQMTSTEDEMQIVDNDAQCENAHA